LPSEFDNLFSTASQITKNVLGETLTLNPLGVTANAQQVADCVWDENEPTLDREKGRDNVRTGNLYVPVTVSLDLKDTWTIGGELWQVEAWGEKDAVWQRVKLVARAEIVRRPSRPS